MDLSRPDTRPWGPHPGMEPGPRGWSLDHEGSGGGAWTRRALGVEPGPGGLWAWHADSGALL